MNTQTQIQEARKILTPSPVRIGHVPGWLRRHLQQQLKGKRETHFSGWLLLQFAAAEAKAESAFDHVGSTPINGRQVLVSEPYMSVDSLTAGKRFAESFDLDFSYSANSWWYPGSTIRLIFSKKGSR